MIYKRILNVILKILLCVIVVNCKFHLNVFKNNTNNEEGFLFKYFSIYNQSFPVKFEKLNYNVAITFCSHFNYLDVHAVSYPKKLDYFKSYLILDKCSIFSCKV